MRFFLCAVNYYSHTMVTKNINPNHVWNAVEMLSGSVVFLA